MPHRRIYLAAPFGEYLKVQAYADDLRHRGHAITSRWHSDHVSIWLKDPSKQAGYLGPATEDLHDLREADTLISFTEPEGTGYTSGGRHVEFGYAMARGHDLFVLGPVENIFMNFAQVCSTWEQLVGLL